MTKIENILTRSIAQVGLNYGEEKKLEVENLCGLPLLIIYNKFDRIYICCWFLSACFRIQKVIECRSRTEPNLKHCFYAPCTSKKSSVNLSVKQSSVFWNSEVKIEYSETLCMWGKKKNVNPWGLKVFFWILCNYSIKIC